MNDFSVFDDLGHVAKHPCQVFVSTLLIIAMLSIDMCFLVEHLLALAECEPECEALCVTK
jgi:hypothetical protein